MIRPFVISMSLLMLIAAGGLVWLLTPKGETAPRLRPDDTAVVAQGAVVYAENCAACHGADLSGEPGWPDWRIRKPDGRLAAPPHDESGHTWHHPDEVLFQITKLGTAGAIGDPNYESDMPAFGEVLSDAEIEAVLSYIKSTWRGRAREANAEINRQAGQN
ncbi:c-type cytochrome [Denitrobaculum tricleocarpae]|uniref:Cytochrome c n=1 Tax=Denitrobaculum tricleocarpae TaxID=2591009 RepID=A0A545U1J6_9PROT|nr:cytochrome c [Denitrobaculum tricleocarpae]TQV83351.1 cytochrome c [Denitrobaculum tricleocarpae]